MHNIYIHTYCITQQLHTEQKPKINEAFKAFSSGLIIVWLLIWRASLSYSHLSRIVRVVPALSLYFLSLFCISLLLFNIFNNIFKFSQLYNSINVLNYSKGMGGFICAFLVYGRRKLIGHMLLLKSVSSCSQSIMERFNHFKRDSMEKKEKNEGKEHNKWKARKWMNTSHPLCNKLGQLSHISDMGM